MSELIYKTPKQIIESGKYPFTLGQLRWFLFYRNKNGLQNAVRKVGRRLLIRADLFDLWLDEQKEV